MKQRREVKCFNINAERERERMEIWFGKKKGRNIIKKVKKKSKRKKIEEKGKKKKQMIKSY